MWTYIKQERVVYVVWLCSTGGLVKKQEQQDACEDRALLCFHEVEGLPCADCPNCQQQIPRVYVQILHLDCYKSRSFLDQFPAGTYSCPSIWQKLIGLESCWLPNWDSDKKHKSLRCITGFITKDTRDSAKMMLKAIKRKANMVEGGLCLIPKLKVYHKHFLMPTTVCIYTSVYKA